MHKNVFTIFVFVFVISLLNGCGNSSGDTAADSDTSVHGTAAADAPLVGTVTLKDSTNPPVVKTTRTDGEGRYSIAVSGLTPPFLLSVLSAETPTAARFYSYADGPGIANINPFSTTTVGAAAGPGDTETVSEAATTTIRAISDRYHAVKNSLEEKLDPLFEFYGIDEDPVTGDYESEKQEFTAFSRSITMSVGNGTVQVLNRQTGEVIFTAPARNISSGMFYTQNMPACAYTYTEWGPCLPDNTQTRTIAAMDPPGCPGIPELTRNCSSLPDAPTPRLLLRDSFSSTQAPSRWLGHAERVYSGNRVTVTGSYTIAQIQLRMYNVGSPNQNLQVGIYSHDAVHDRPGSLIGSWSNPVSNANFTKTAPGQTVTFTGLNVPVAPGTYWIVFNIPTGSGDNNYNYSVAACVNTTPRGQTYYNSGWGEFMNSQIIFGLYSAER